MNGEEYKVGDTLICEPGWTQVDASGGAGYLEGRVFKVMRISGDKDKPDKLIYWPPAHDGHGTGNGIYGRAVKLQPVIINDYQIY